MLRQPVRQTYAKFLRVPNKMVFTPSRNQSSDSLGTAKTVLISAIGATAAGVGGAVAYANYDQKFKKESDNNAPYSNVLLQLQTQLAKQEAMETQKMANAVKMQRQDDERFAETKIALEFAKLKSELELEYQKKISTVPSDLEDELRHQLRRQVAVHGDHLREQLEVQQRELERRFQILMEDKTLADRHEYQNHLKSSLMRLDEIEEILKEKNKLDAQELHSRELWLICQILKDSLKFSSQPNLEPTPIKLKISSIQQSIAEQSGNDSLTSIALKSVPKAAIENGIYTEDALIDRFSKIDRLCRRVALIGDEGGNLFKYVASYVCSLLLIEKETIPKGELNDEQINPSSWNTFDILTRVRYYLRRRNLEMALRYANQLSGAPRQVVKDWIKDTRLHLETKQAADILVACASSVSVQTVK